MRSRHSELGQNIIEYTLVFLLVVVVVVVFLAPKGILEKRVNQSLDQGVTFIGNEMRDAVK